MDQTELVVERIKAGRELLDRLESQFPIHSAAWLLRDGAREWSLYIATTEMSQQHELLLDDAIAELRSLWIPSSRVQLISSDNPVAIASIKYRNRDHAIAQFDGGIFGGIGVEVAFIYGAGHARRAVA